MKCINSFVGSGNAASTFPSLFPFLSLLPHGVMGDMDKFLNRWFDTLEEAVADDKVRLVNTEHNAIVR